jgi:hypothetical protein
LPSPAWLLPPPSPPEPQSEPFGSLLSLLQLVFATRRGRFGLGAAARVGFAAGAGVTATGGDETVVVTAAGEIVVTITGALGALLLWVVTASTTATTASVNTAAPIPPAAHFIGLSEPAEPVPLDMKHRSVDR